MTIALSYYAILREQRGLSAESRDTNAKTPAELYEELRHLYPFTLEARWIRAAINDDFVTMDAPLHEGDRVIFIPPVAGG